MFGPVIFTKNLGMGFRLFINPVKNPALFLLVGMPLLVVPLAWNALMVCLDVVWALGCAVWYLLSALFHIVASVTFKSNKETA